MYALRNSNYHHQALQQMGWFASKIQCRFSIHKKIKLDRFRLNVSTCKIDVNPRHAVELHQTMKRCNSTAFRGITSNDEAM
jgi:hypothetical protein